MFPALRQGGRFPAPRADFPVAITQKEPPSAAMRSGAMNPIKAVQQISVVPPFDDDIFGFCRIDRDPGDKPGKLCKTECPEPGIITDRMTKPRRQAREFCNPGNALTEKQNHLQTALHGIGLSTEQPPIKSENEERREELGIYEAGNQVLSINRSTPCGKAVPR